MQDNDEVRPEFERNTKTTRWVLNIINDAFCSTSTINNNVAFHVHKIEH